jgi:hypothetical protein
MNQFRFIAEKEMPKVSSGFFLMNTKSKRLMFMTRREERQPRRIVLFDHLDELVEAWSEFQKSTSD